LNTLSQCYLPLFLQETVLSVVAAVLHLGNVEFGQNNSDEAVLASPAALEELETVAALLQVWHRLRFHGLEL